MHCGTWASISTAVKSQTWQEVTKQEITEKSRRDTLKLFSHVKCTCIYHSHHQWDKQVNPSLFFFLYFSSPQVKFISLKKNNKKNQTTVLAGSLMKWGNSSPFIHCLHHPKPYSGSCACGRQSRHILYTTTEQTCTNYHYNPYPSLSTEYGLQYLITSLPHRQFSSSKSAGFISQLGRLLGPSLLLMEGQKSLKATLSEQLQYRPVGTQLRSCVLGARSIQSSPKPPHLH